MVSTGTTNFAPATSGIVLTALSRNQIRGAQITTEHLYQAETEVNLIQVKYSNKQPNLFLSDLTPLSLTADTATYTLPATVIDIIIIYMTVTSGGVSTDRVLGPMSTTEYASQPDKTTSGPPTSYFFNRLATPQITFWPVPDDTATYTANYRFLRQPYDASLKSGTTFDTPYRWLDAYGWELTARMAAHFKPEFFEKWQLVADDAWMTAASEDTENVAMHIAPACGGYYR